MRDLQDAKRVVLDLYESLDGAADRELDAALAKHVTADYAWRGVHPFDEIAGPESVAERFWAPLRRAFRPIQRRPDVFLAGRNNDTIEQGEPGAVWVCQMGTLLGLFDRPWLGIPPTRRMCLVPYVDFHRVEGGLIAESAQHVDVLSVMRQAGHDPLPPATGTPMVAPGPRTHDGLLFHEGDPAEGEATMAVVEAMVAHLTAANDGPDDARMPPEVLAETWHDDMLWWGPDGIGASYTIDRYQEQHQYPFRLQLTDKRFNGHVARFAEGHYACFFGWPNLTNRPTGGFLGLPGTDVAADMRVVDVYRRDGDKLAENWVFIDVLHWLDQQGVDVLARLRQRLGTETI